jgi:hypothetical protein
MKCDLPLEQNFDILAIRSLEGRGGRDFGTESFKFSVRETTKRSGPSISEDTW